MKQINFDMDGTIADFYSVPNWLHYLENGRTDPYEQAKPLVNMNKLSKQINRLKAKGYEINIISWSSKCGAKEFHERIKKAKVEWLKENLPTVKFDKINIVPYGTPKYTLGSGILFDDEEGNRNAWKDTAYDEKNIIEVLKKY